jgi:hypothetical protein
MLAGMSAFRPQILAAIACLALSATSFANVTGFFGGNWHVVENLRTQACYRVTEFRPMAGWRDLGTFNTFRTAGRFVWSHRDRCKSSPVFN